ncbi:MAG: YrhA family protein [Lactobacillales bacterium]|jgi:hypothetical protein|nr:YrhA family protein [Lactobacillales bacterium]
MIIQLLQSLHKNYAHLFPGTPLETIQKASAFLVKSGRPEIPADYIIFLNNTNGLMWNGLELFCLAEYESEDRTIKYRGLMQSNLIPLPALYKNFLLLGTYLDTLVLFDRQKNVYALLDQNTYETVFAFPNFADLLSFIARPVLEKK